jgi:chemotaxis signal transduction protein
VGDGSITLRNSRMVPESHLYDLVPFLAGDQMFAVVAEQVEGTAEAKAPAPLPLGPASVLGVVCVRGRMLTVLDPVAIITGESPEWPTILPRVIALRGDQQLALAAQECHDTITVAAADIRRTTKSADDSSEQALMGIARHGGEEITILNVDQLFAAIPWRRERRRRRF